MVDKEGIDLSDACEILKDEYNSKKRMWVSWGDYDRVAFERECKYKGIPYPFGRTHTNLKEWFAFIYGLKQAPGVSNALKKLDIEFYGTMHRGVDDAFNTALILQKMLKTE
jgi:inhibitor of KinA sporulation pathway (predicted exonuclease)